MAERPRLRQLLPALTWPEWRQHPWRQAVAVIAIALGVALAYAVHLINASALAEFSAAVRTVNGQPDLSLRAQADGFDEALYGRVARDARVAAASPVVEVDTYARQADGQRLALRVLGLDAFAAGALSPSLVPRPREGADRLAVISPDRVFLNAQARARLGAIDRVELQIGGRWFGFEVAGDVSADGPPMLVMDIAGVQQHFGHVGRLSRLDLRLRPGLDARAFVADLALPPSVRASTPDDAALRVSNLSRAYRVNLTVLALVALFTGGFLVFSVLALGVAQRQPQFALLGVLGLDAGTRRRLVLAESLLLGLAGAIVGLLLGAGLALAALRFLAGDLGGGYFPGVRPSLQAGWLGAVVHAALGLVTAAAGGWLPARMAERLAPAQALKGLGAASSRPGRVGWLGPLALLAGVALAFAPPLFGIPLAAYLSVACLLLGGIACVPSGVALLLRLVPPPRGALALLAVERARDQRHQATIAMAGVVASLSLAVALTVMVASFRHSVTQWLDTVLPADVYVRSARSSAAADTAFLPEAFVQSLRNLPGVNAVEALRVVSLDLQADRPPVALVARPIDAQARALPLVGDLVPAQTGLTSAYVSEAMRDLYGAVPGQRLRLPLPGGQSVDLLVRGIWRDYARQHGAVALDLADYQRLTGDTRVNDVALRLAGAAARDAAAGATDGDTSASHVMADIQQRIRALAPDPSLIEFATAGEIRAVSLAIFDRSFAVTYWLQGVAVGIGLFGVAASFSAQVMARRKELGLLTHLGLARRQILQVVAGEGAAWTAAGALLGIALGLAVSVVLVHVVNPQSFHWTMDLLVPWDRVALLFAAVLAAGTVTAWAAAGRSTGGRRRGDLLLSVKEDW